MTPVLIAIAVVVAFIVVVRVLARVWPRTIVVRETEHALRYRDGRFLGTVEPGRHRLWSRRDEIVTLDGRERVLEVRGQEILTEDNLGVKVTLALRFAVADPARVVHGSEDPLASLYLAAQIALRDAVASVDAESLLGDREALGVRIRAAAEKAADGLGYSLAAAEIKDITMPAELRRAFSELIRAKKEGEAELERTRARTAALRSLANAARLFDDHPALLELRLLETLDAAGRAGKNTLVLGVPEHLARHKGDRHD